MTSAWHPRSIWLCCRQFCLVSQPTHRDCCAVEPGPGHTVVPVLTGVIYGAIVVAWATYLVPLALRRDEQQARARSIDRLSSAMRVLVSRGSRVPAEPARPVASTVNVIAPTAPEPELMLVTPTPNRAAERAAAARRRVVLYVLGVLTVVCGLSVAVGLVPRWSLWVPIALIAGFLVVARQSVRKATAPYWVEVEGHDGDSGAVDLAERHEAEDTVTIQLSAPAPSLPSAASVAPAAPRVANGSTLWDPLPVTLPTYVEAPAARRTFRTIDLRRETVATAEPLPAPHAKDAVVVESDVREVPQAVNG